MTYIFKKSEVNIKLTCNDDKTIRDKKTMNLIMFNFLKEKINNRQLEIEYRLVDARANLDERALQILDRRG